MKRVSNMVGVVIALTACAGPAAVAQASTGARGAQITPNIYEIAPEQVAPAQQQEAPFIEVSGTGTASVTPDRATVSFAMETRAASAAEAAGANARAMQRVLDAIRRGGFPGLTLSTFGYTLRPEYAPAAGQRTREIVAYVALNNVRATTSDVEAVGRVIDAAIGAGANRVASLSFGASDTGPARSEALAEAVENARSQAAVIARSLGYELGPPLEVRGDGPQPVPIPARGMTFAAEQAVPTPIEVGEETVTAFVTIRFALGRELGG